MAEIVLIRIGVVPSLRMVGTLCILRVSTGRSRSVVSGEAMAVVQGWMRIVTSNGKIAMMRIEVW